jgi:dimethylhistidine N-methyltransferase
MQRSGPRAEFAADVARDLGKQPKQLQAKYLYDPLGSSLFDAICRLPWYRITRAEHRLLAAHAGGVAAALPAAAGVTLIELGCGKGDKLARLARAVANRTPFADVHLIDVSELALGATARRLLRFPHFTVSSHQAAYEEGLARAVAGRRDQPAIALFLGSNIGNFDPPDAEALLRRIRTSLRAGDFLLLGADLVKPERDLLLAYDDPLGVTAAFNKNLLVRINRELGGAFDLQWFDHEARWNAGAGRVEMHLVSRRAQRVPIAAIDVLVDLEAGESLWTESSYKYEPEQIVSTGAAAGFTLAEQWMDDRARFALTLFRT